MPQKQQIQSMFDAIAPTYDSLNHVLSLNIDKIWRRKAVRIIKNTNPKNVLDIACGTGDSTIALAKAGIQNVVGIDISKEMLYIGEKKLTSKNLNTTIKFYQVDCEHLIFDDTTYDAVMVAFGVRNFEDKEKGLREILRVLKPDGILVILELSVPKNKIILALYKLYFLHVLPFIGKMISGNKEAYSYLPKSVINFPKPNDFILMMEKCGFKNVKHKALSLGLCRIFEGKKF